jgi:hypothetical protein
MPIGEKYTSLFYGIEMLAVLAGLYDKHFAFTQFFPEMYFSRL